jgi:adenine nucleotide transporter 17
LKPSQIKALRRIVEDEGFVSLYAGAGSDALSSALSSFAFFYCHVFFRKELAKRQNLTAGKAPAISALQEVLLGCLAGIISKGCTMPLSNLVVRMQTSSEEDEKGPTTIKNRSSVLDVAKDIMEEKGVSGFWSGFKSTVVLTLSPSLNLWLFESLKRLLLPRSKQEHPPAAVIFLVSSLASLVSSSALYPLILAKTRLQWKTPAGRSRYRSTREVLQTAYKQDQLKGLCTCFSFWLYFHSQSAQSSAWKVTY